MVTTCVTTCAACGQKNRLSPRHLPATGRCGRCKADLPALTTPLDVDTETLDEILRSSPIPVLVEFWAPWCQPCKIVAPEVARVAREMAERALVLKVDTDQHPELAVRYNLAGIPHLSVFSGGEVLFEQFGAVRAAEMERWLEHAAAAAQVGASPT